MNRLLLGSLTFLLFISLTSQQFQHSGSFGRNPTRTSPNRRHDQQGVGLQFGGRPNQQSGFGNSGSQNFGSSNSGGSRGSGGHPNRHQAFGGNQNSGGSRPGGFGSSPSQGIGFGSNQQFGGHGQGFGGRPNQQFSGQGQSFGGNRPSQGGNTGTIGFDGKPPSRAPHSNALSIRGCFCLPSNQICDPNGDIPFAATRVKDIIKVRIVNTSPSTTCAEAENPCCFASIDLGEPLPNPPGGSVLGNCGKSRSIFSGRSGTSEADFGEYPWMAAITTERDEFVATGALINPRWVLTAAHKLQKPGQLVVRLGDYDLNVRSEFPSFPHATIKVKRIIFHPHFNPENLFNDIALILLDRPVPFSQHIHPVCLPEQNQKFLGKRCWVSGWGFTSQKQFSQIMREVDVPTVEEFTCDETLRATNELGRNFQLNRTSFLCAGGEEGKDACRGDGGAPLVCEEFQGQFTVIGLVAWGLKGCGRIGIPGVYVNVASFANFIKDNIF